MERDVVLVGSDAASWLQARGWRSHAAALSIAADTFTSGTARYSRMSLSPGAYGYATPEITRSSTVTALLLVEGSASVELDGLRAPFPAGSLLLLADGSCATVDSTTTMAVYEVSTSSVRIGLSEDAVADHAGPYASEPDYWLALTSVLNQILGSSIEPEDLGAETLGSAIDTLLLAALQQSSAFDLLRNDADTLRHLRTARSIIRAESWSLDFSVGRLAEMANMSRSHLHRVFACVNSTPLGEIRLERVRTAQKLMAAGGRRGGPSLAEVAHRSGFRTVAAMRRAMRAAAESGFLVDERRR